MKQSDIYLLIAGMAAATYIPRALPALFMDKLTLGRRAKKFLMLLPYTAMSALIFPGVLFIDNAHPAFGIAGAAAAVLLSLKKCPLIVSVLGAVGICFLLYSL